MKFWLKLLIICAVLGLGGYSISRFVFTTDTPDRRQRLTVVVDTLAGDVKGASVAAVEVLRRRPLAEAMRLFADIPLEAPNQVPIEQNPRKVTFDDISRPETVRLADPENLSKAFGPRVNLRGGNFRIDYVRSDQGKNNLYPTLAC